MEQSQEKFLKPRKMNDHKLFISKESIVKIFDFRKLLIIFCLILLGGYLFYRIIIIFLPPYLEILSPIDKIEVNDFSLKISGKTDRLVEVYINNKMVPNQDGYFEEEVKLLPGINNLKISAKKKYSKEKIIFRQIIYNP